MAPKMMIIRQKCLKSRLEHLFQPNVNGDDTMNMNRLVNMGLRMLTNKGIALAARKGKQPQDMTPQERLAAKMAQQNANKARRGLGLVRRFMR